MPPPSSPQSHLQSPSTTPIFKNYLDMPVWQLRHLQVSRYIEQHNITRVLDVGCAEGTLLNRLSRSADMGLLMGFDLDVNVLKTARVNVEPEMIQDSVGFFRKEPLEIELYNLNALKEMPLGRFRQAELVTMIEFIEHIPKIDLPRLVENVFGRIRPKFVMITTPNGEFNVHFNFKPGQFRHPEHLFEWTREQFLEFCQNINKEYGYSFELFGIGQHFQDESLGPCSQGAFFTRKQLFEYFIPNTVDLDIDPYHKVRYPFWRDRIQASIQSQIRSILFKNNYISPDELLSTFNKTKIGKKINEQLQKPKHVPLEIGLQDQALFLTSGWIVAQAQKTLHCYFDQASNSLFYQYLPSSQSQEDAMMQESACDEQLAQQTQ